MYESFTLLIITARRRHGPNKCSEGVDVVYRSRGNFYYLFGSGVRSSRSITVRVTLGQCPQSTTESAGEGRWSRCTPGTDDQSPRETSRSGVHLETSPAPGTPRHPGDTTDGCRDPRGVRDVEPRCTGVGRNVSP